MPLNDYNIKESKFSNPKFKEFISCVFNSIDEKSTNRCGIYLPQKFKIQSGGDMRCSGKSESLHLMFPSRLHDVDEEDAIYRGSSNIESTSGKLYINPDYNTLVIYVKRHPSEKLKCLLKYRAPYTKENKDIDGFYARLPNELKKEAYEDTEIMRKELLPDLYTHDNYLLLENNTKEEEPFITEKKICNVSDIKIKTLKEEINNEIDFYTKLIKEEPLLKEQMYFHRSINRLEKHINYLEEYKSLCNLNNKMKEVYDLMDDLKNI